MRRLYGKGSWWTQYYIQSQSYKDFVFEMKIDLNGYQASAAYDQYKWGVVR